MGRILPQLVYWNTALLQDQFKARDAFRYVCFDVDQGGLNNIRLVFEYVAIIAAITGRTLVLPPPQPWYLLNHGPKHQGREEGLTEFGEIFDLTALKQVIPIQTTPEFIGEAARHLSIPAIFLDADAFADRDQGYGLRHQWRQWLLDNAQVMAGWNPYNTLICYPDKARADISVLPEHYVDGRQFIEFTPRINAAPFIYFPSTSEQRSLGPVATMLVSHDDELLRRTRRLIKHHIRYRDEVFELASRFVSRLGPYRYQAVHIRRNDFQYKEARTHARSTRENIQPLLNGDLPVYVATDETDEDFRAELRGGMNMYFWEDIQEFCDLDIPEKYIGPVEQLICTCAARFIGTDLSTFSSYIVRLRGYTRAPDMASYFHTEHCAEPKPEPGIECFPGRSYLRENPLYWLDC